MLCWSLQAEQYRIVFINEDERLDKVKVMCRFTEENIVSKGQCILK